MEQEKTNNVFKQVFLDLLSLNRGYCSNLGGQNRNCHRYTLHAARVLRSITCEEIAVGGSLVDVLVLFRRKCNAPKFDDIERDNWHYPMIFETQVGDIAATVAFLPNNDADHIAGRLDCAHPIITKKS